MAKPKRRKASLHSAGKVTEQEILERARALYEDPSLAMPECDGSCVLFSPVKSAQRGISRAHAARDDEAKLTRLASSGNELARAYAATILLAKADKIPFVADIKLAGEIVPYVIRGRAKPFYLAGVQHYDDRALRLLAVASWARKRGMHFYSADRGIVCTGRRAEPPVDFLDEEAELVGLQKRNDKRYDCGHDGDRIALTWKNVDVVFERCLECARDTSLAGSCLRHVAGPRPARTLGVEVKLTPLQARSGAAPAADAPLRPEVQQAYLSGKISDAALLQAARTARVDALKAGGAHYVAGDDSYGDDVDAFLRALGPGPDEERALRAALAAHKGAVILDRASLARAISDLWPTQGRVMLEAVSDAATAAEVYKEKVAPDETVELVRKAARRGAGRAALASLPAYSGLPPAASAADAIARTFRANGREAAIRVAQERANVAQAKGITLAMLTALGGQRGQEWRFSGSDQDIARVLAPHVETMLRGDPASYHDALVAASRQVGETTEFRPR